MSYTQTSLTSGQETITPQEYHTYKRRLLELRRQYAELLHASRFEKDEAYAEKLSELDREITETEETLARCTIATPESAPITLRELFDDAYNAALAAKEWFVERLKPAITRTFQGANSKLSFGESETKDKLA